ncbi:MAG: type II toxin-antitoxin system RelE/ParE family toxin [Bacteroidia bacterium]
MEMKILWTQESVDRLKNIFDYYNYKASYKIANKIVEGIIKQTELLSHNPFIGQREELLHKRTIKYYYLIYTNYKIIYWIGNDLIYIATVFDTRQNPDKIRRGIK